jgi:hypothetical protein
MFALPPTVHCVPLPDHSHCVPLPECAITLCAPLPSTCTAHAITGHAVSPVDPRLALQAAPAWTFAHRPAPADPDDTPGPGAYDARAAAHARAPLFGPSSADRAATIAEARARAQQARPSTRSGVRRMAARRAQPRSVARWSAAARMGRRAQGQAYVQSVRAQLGLPARRNEPAGLARPEPGEDAAALFTGGPRLPTSSYGSEPSVRGSFSYLSVYAPSPARRPIRAYAVHPRSALSCPSRHPSPHRCCAARPPAPLGLTPSAPAAMRLTSSDPTSSSRATQARTPTRATSTPLHRQTSMTAPTQRRRRGPPARAPWPACAGW